MFGSVQLSSTAFSTLLPDAQDLLNEACRPEDSSAAHEGMQSERAGRVSPWRALRGALQECLRGEGSLASSLSVEQMQLLQELAGWAEQGELSRRFPLGPSEVVGQAIDLVYKLGGQRDLLGALSSSSCRSSTSQGIAQREQVWRQLCGRLLVSGPACAERQAAIHEMIDALSQWAGAGFYDAPQRVETAQWRILCLLLQGPPLEEWDQQIDLQETALGLLRAPLEKIADAYRSPLYAHARWQLAQELKESLMAIEAGPWAGAVSDAMRAQVETLYQACADETASEPPEALRQLLQQCCARQGAAQGRDWADDQDASSSGAIPTGRPVTDWDRELARLFLARHRRGRPFSGKRVPLSCQQQVFSGSGTRLHERMPLASPSELHEQSHLEDPRELASRPPEQAAASAESVGLFPAELLEAQSCPMHSWTELERWLSTTCDVLLQLQDGGYQRSRLLRFLHDQSSGGLPFGNFLSQGLFFFCCLQLDMSFWSLLEEDYRSLFEEELETAIGPALLHGRAMEWDEALDLLQGKCNLIQGLCELSATQRIALGFSYQIDVWTQFLKGVGSVESGSWIQVYLLQVGLEGILALSEDQNAIKCALDAMEGHGVGPTGQLVQRLLGQMIASRASSQGQVAALGRFLRGLLEQPGWTYGWRSLRELLAVVSFEDGTDRTEPDV